MYIYIYRYLEWNTYKIQNIYKNKIYKKFKFLFLHLSKIIFLEISLVLKMFTILLRYKIPNEAQILRIMKVVLKDTRFNQEILPKYFDIWSFRKWVTKRSFHLIFWFTLFYNTNIGQVPKIWFQFDFPDFKNSHIHITVFSFWLLICKLSKLTEHCL